MMFTSQALSSALRLSPVEAEELLDLSRDIPDTSLDKTSLETSASGPLDKKISYTHALFSLCFCGSSDLGDDSFDLFSFNMPAKLACALDAGKRLAWLKPVLSGEGSG